MHFLQCSSQLLKAVAKLTAISDLTTPSQAFLMLSWSRLQPASPHFDFLNKKKSADTRLDEYGGCLSRRRPWASHQLETTPSMSRGAFIIVEKPQLGHHLLPFQPQILYSMGSRKRPGVNPPVIGYGGGHRGDDIHHATVLLRLRWHAPCLLNNSVSLQRTQAPVPMGSLAASTVFLFL
jgi:hypothetical protein